MNLLFRKRIFIGFVLTIFLVFISLFIFRLNKSYSLENDEIVDSNSLEQVDNNYGNYVITNQISNIYKLYDEEFVTVGKVGMGIELELDGIYENYYLIKNLDDDYYIDYTNVYKIDKLSDNDDRFKKYIPFNRNVITKDITNLYDYENNLVYSFNKSLDLPIIIMDDDKYGVEYAGNLYYIYKDDVDYEKDNTNTLDSNTSSIGVLNYHFIYLEGEDCDQSLCVSASQFRSHLDYIKDNNFFTPTMKELEMYIDGKINLPKSIVITIDDGALAQNAKNILNEYKLNGTLFLITSWFNPSDFESEYLEVASHGDDLHNVGVCSGGQGGAIKCLDYDKLLSDLKTSREKLNNTTYFCYPFYEYNDYSISVLKDAGFTMSFAGESINSYNMVSVGSDKFRLPRFVVVDYTTMDDFKKYLDGEFYS